MLRDIPQSKSKSFSMNDFHLCCFCNYMAIKLETKDKIVKFKYPDALKNLKISR